MPVVSIKWVSKKAQGGGGHLELLDQTKLPVATHWIACSQAAEVIDAIKCLAVRGAPAIGIAGAYAYCLAAQHAIDLALDSHGGINDGKALIDQIAAQSPLIAAARPTAVNLQWAVNRMDRVLTKYTYTVPPFCPVYSNLQFQAQRFMG
jgi:methylthioribose-1-phosphate isomerase